jgi:hypothetical protein
MATYCPDCSSPVIDNACPECGWSSDAPPITPQNHRPNSPLNTALSVSAPTIYKLEEKIFLLEAQLEKVTQVQERTVNERNDLDQIVVELRAANITLQRQADITLQQHIDDVTSQ